MPLLCIKSCLDYCDVDLISKSGCLYRKMKPEELMKIVGKFGPYQIMTLITIYVLAILAATPVMTTNVFVVYTPPHRCFIPKIDKRDNSTSTHDKLPDLPSR